MSNRNEDNQCGNRQASEIKRKIDEDKSDPIGEIGEKQHSWKKF